MFRTDPTAQDASTSDYAELKRIDLVHAIETAKVEGFEATEEALVELLSVLDDVLGEGGSIEYRYIMGTAS